MATNRDYKYIWFANPVYQDDYGNKSILGYNNLQKLYALYVPATSELDYTLYGNNVTNVLKFKIDKPFNYSLDGGDGIYLSEPTVIPFVTASDNGRMYYSSSSDVINSTKLPTNIYTNLHKDYMSINYNSNQLVPPLSQQPIKGIGFISQNVSDSSGNIADVTFTLNYSMAFEQTSFIITFNSVDKEYAVAFTVNFYNQDVLVGTITETNNTLVNYSKTIDFNADKIVINITKWSKPSRFAVINQINSGRNGYYKKPDYIAKPIRNHRNIYLFDGVKQVY